MASRFRISDHEFQRLLRELSVARTQVGELGDRLDRSEDAVGFRRLQSALDAYSDVADKKARALEKRIDSLSEDLRGTQESFHEAEKKIAEILANPSIGINAGYDAVRNVAGAIGRFF